jgi:hypothetical protein
LGGERGISWANISGPEGYFALTVGRDEKVIREYIKKQEIEDKRLEQLSLLK